MSDDRIQNLIGKYHAGELSEEERVELERTLLSSPQARQLFWEEGKFHALMARWGQEEWGRRMAQAASVAEKDPSPSPAKSIRNGRLRSAFQSPWLYGSLSAAACLIVLALVLLNGRLGFWKTNPAVEVGIAVLDSSLEAKWKDGEPRRTSGAILGAGVLQLESGAVRIEFYSGASLIIQGPAEVELISEMRAVCRKGRVTAHVPAPARGFTVSGPGIEVVDLGTEFGIDVPVDGPPDVHVFNGTVEVNRPGISEPPTSLVVGEAVELTPNGLRRMAADMRGFITHSEFSRLTADESGRRREMWRIKADAISRDPATLVHFLFGEDAPNSRTIDNLARQASTPAIFGSIVGCDWGEARWEGHRAIDFRGPADRIRLDVPGELRAITLLAWVRIDSLPNSSNALLVPDGVLPGAIRWSISGAGEMRLGIWRQVTATSSDWEAVISPKVLTPERMGQWVLLATTFDGKTVHHYLDGQLVKKLPAHSPVPLVIGTAEIGNWRGQTPRFLPGRMDEFAILSRSMSAEEVQAVYEAGKPAMSSQPRR